MIVTIAIMAVGVVGIVGALAQTENLSGITQSQANLEVAMRQVSDYVRDSSAAGLKYSWCDSPAYVLPAPPAGSGITWTITGVKLGASATRVGSSGTISTPPVTRTGCPASTGDWGVQEITIKVTSGSRSLVRTVWKSATW